MKTIDELKKLAAEISQPMSATQKKRQEINKYIENLESEKAAIEVSEDENFIAQIVDLNSKIEQSKKMLQKEFPSRHTYEKSTEYFGRYDQLFQSYTSELKKEIDPDIKQIKKLATEIQSLLEKTKNTELSKYLELQSVVSNITSYVDNRYISDFQFSLKRLDHISTSGAVSDQLRHLLRRILD